MTGRIQELRRRQQAEMEAQEMSDDDDDEDQAGESNPNQKSKAGKQTSGKNSPISQEQLGMLLSQMATMQQMSSPRQVEPSLFLGQ